MSLPSEGRTFCDGGSSCRCCFMDLAILGVYDGIESEGISDWVAMWHQGHGASRPLCDLLGMSQEQYDVWVENPVIIQFIVMREKERRGIET